VEGGFRWHPGARLIGPDGALFTGPEGAGQVLPDRPGVDALRAALTVPGQAFRIGGGDAAPAGADVPMFETLTSGSSGTPRRIWRSQASWRASFAVNARLFGIGPGVRVAVPGRLSQSLALYGALEGLHLGAEVHLLDGLRPDRQRTASAMRRVEVLYASPAQLRLLAETRGAALDALRLVLVGGSKLDAGLRAAVAAMAPDAVVREFYGAAEASFITLAEPDTPEDAVGPPYPGVRIAVREGDREVAEGTRGVVWVQSPYLFDGYAGDAGPAVWRDGWLSVGEIGWMRQGALILAGRISRMVTIADHNVFPEEIEAFLASQPGVRQAAVIARPDARRGHVLEAVLQGDPACEAAVRGAVRARFGALAAPRLVVWRADWPLLPSGKTDLAALT
jgi:long-chain acyl-CoA synthetase